MAISPEDRDGEPVLSSRPAPGVARIALNRPRQRNALTEPLARALGAAVAAAVADPQVRALIVTGVGAAFCAGADLGSLGAEARNTSERRELLSDYYRAFLDLRSVPVPTVAAINGPAIGAGLNLALCCDLRLIADDARLAAPFVRLGIHPSGGATWMLTRLAGAGVARELLLLGEAVGPERAVAMGLASRVVPAAELEAAALDWATTLASFPRTVISDLRRSIGMAEAGASLEELITVETLAQAESLGTEDAREGWAAVREHRRPTFHDR